MSQKILLHQDWRFLAADDPAADYMGYDDSAWKRVTLPHDWAVEYPFSRNHSSGTGYLPGGTAWYRKHFSLPENIGKKKTRIVFGGVYKHAKIWINSYYLGSWAYGYSTFSFDISPFVRPGENVVCVRVEHNDVADSRWFTGSGIYRDVSLVISDPVCFREYGIYAVNRKATEKAAELSVAYETEGADFATFRLIDREGQTVAYTSSDTSSGTVTLRVANPELWRPENPVLYTLRCETGRNGIVTDTEEIPTGLRVFRFDPDLGFFLNGVNMKLKGVCIHHDAGTLGAAVPKSVWARRLKKLKECGCNAIRTAHNPPDPLLLDLCDEMGFLVMDEAFDEWEGCKNKWWQGHNVYPPKHYGYAEDFPQWHRADLETMIRRDRNHPSVILWSIGNEIDYPNDPYVTPLFNEVLGNNDANKPLQERLYDVRRPDASRLVTVAKELTETVHQLDNSRPVTSAMSFPELSTRTGFSGTLDLLGYNYREKYYDEDHLRFPDRAILGSENSTSAEAWFDVEDREFISGQFLWTGIDFLGECPGWPVRISQAGLLNLAGFEKPLFYLRKALWTKQPSAKLAVGKSASPWEQSFCWSGTEGEMLTVSCYTNQPEAALYLNGVPVGTRPAGRANGYQARWELPYAAGELTVHAGEASDRLITPGKAVSVQILPDRNILRAGEYDIAQLEIRLLDEAGEPAAADDRSLFVQVLGDAKILGMENGKPDDLTPYSEPFRSTFRGRMIVYIRSGVLPGPVTVSVFDREGDLRSQCTLQISSVG